MSDGRQVPHQWRAQSPRDVAWVVLTRSHPRFADRPFPAAQRRRLQPLDRRADRTPAPQVQKRSGAAALYPNRAWLALRLRSPAADDRLLRRYRSTPSSNRHEARRLVRFPPRIAYRSKRSAGATDLPFPQEGQLHDRKNTAVPAGGRQACGSIARSLAALSVSSLVFPLPSTRPRP